MKTKDPNPNKIELVVARYNEDLRWINKDPFRSYPIICYNKGDNDNYEIKTKNKKIINLENVGKCDHTYLYHIIENYENLADVTVFLPGSTDVQYKIKKAKKIILNVEKTKNSVFVCNYYNNVKQDLYNFQLDTYETFYHKNYKKNSDIRIQKATIRPYGKWFESKFDNLIIHHVSFWGIMAISREHILQHSKEYYLDLLHEVDKDISPEAGHFIERSWEAIFYPMEDALFMN